MWCNGSISCCGLLDEGSIPSTDALACPNGVRVTHDPSKVGAVGSSPAWDYSSTYMYFPFVLLAFCLRPVCPSVFLVNNDLPRPASIALAGSVVSL